MQVSAHVGAGRLLGLGEQQIANAILMAAVSDHIFSSLVNLTKRNPAVLISLTQPLYGQIVQNKMPPSC